MRSSQGEWDQDLAPPQVPLGIIAVSVLRLKSTLKKKKKKSTLLTALTRPCMVWSLLCSQFLFIPRLISVKYATHAPTPGPTFAIALPLPGLPFYYLFRVCLSTTCRSRFQSMSIQE